MKLRDIISGTKIFIDSNIFIYHFTGVSDECTKFLSRCERGELIGMTSTNVLLEVLHRLMMVEALRKGLEEPPNMVKKLAKAPKKVKQLDAYFRHVDKIPEMGIAVHPLRLETISQSHILRLVNGLLVNDSIVLATMQENAIKYLATADKVFENFTDIEMVSPGDMT